MKRLAYAFVVFVCILQAAMPANAADFTLEIFGNANMDDTIDEDDIEYVEGIIDGTNDATELADANYDGEIDEDDIAQIELIIAGEEKELTFSDESDRIVTVQTPIKRVVTLAPYPAEVIRMLGKNDIIVGVTDSITDDEIYFPELSKLPSVGTSQSNVDVEAVFGLNPDLVILFSDTHVTELAKQLPGIPVADLDLYRPVRFAEEVKILGYMTGEREEAANYIDDFYEYYIDLITKRTKGLSDEERPNVCVEWESEENEYKVFFSESGVQEMLDITGGRNIFADLPGNSGYVDPESIVTKNPDYYIRYASEPAMGYGCDDTSKIKVLWEDIEIMNRPGWDYITAVIDKKVYVIDMGLNYGPDYPIALIYWAKWFHPELFEDLDPKAIHQEYVTKFHGLDFDVSKHGIFVYHPDLYPDGR